jgi:osmotically-inducible protein OsmY
MSQDHKATNNSIPLKPSKLPDAEADAIGADINKALRRSPSFPDNIEVSVDGSEVKLTGAVPSLQDRKTAEATARAEPGAPHVTNEIDIP